jgi:hypothetical protein
MLTQAELKAILHYDPKTGIFVWVVSPRFGIKRGAVAGRVCAKGYGQIQISGKKHSSHRLAFLYMVGSIPKEVDHINRVKDDNRWSNLRPATRQQNQANSSLSRNNKSGYRGVFWNKKDGKWRASIQFEGKHKHLGLFASKHEAYKVYVEASLKYFGEFSPVNPTP